MDLREFVRETLVQITQGVRDAQEAAREAGGAISPAPASWSTQAATYVGMATGNLPIFLVNFDVAVTAAEGTGTGAEAKVEVVSLLSLKAGGKSKQSEERTSRVQFPIPIALPVDQTSKEERDRIARESKVRQDAAIARGGTNWATNWRP